MRFIGDVHAKFGGYLHIIDQCDASIQVGDFGVGFRPVPEGIGSNHRFIRGNHDNPHLVSQYNWIPDRSVDLEKGIFFLGGGFSIDHASRTPGLDWWEEEELSYSQLNDAVDRWEQAKLPILVCHECPATTAKDLFREPSTKWLTPSRTSQALDAMVMAHKPDMVIFGHWHQNRNQMFQGVRYICLAELAWIDINL